MANKIIGRNREIKTLESVFNSNKAEFLSIYGRRRIGKTFLIKEYIATKPCIFLHITGQKQAALKEQLFEFTRKIEQTFYHKGTTLKESQGWMKAFEVLTTAIDEYAKRKKVVLFFDELPWLATKKSRLLQALDYYWNTKWIYNNKLKLIICGSAASWIIKNVVHNRGGLHNRITETIKLLPYTLNESKDFLENKGINLNYKQITDIYMVTGGVPYYLDRIKKGLSAAQNIDELCFHANGLLFKEFDVLFASLFEHSEAHYEIVRLIAKNRYGIDKGTLAKKTKLSSSGGSLNQKMRELEEAGFITRIMPYGHKQKGEYYKISDEYTYFYLSWIEPVKETFRKFDTAYGYWLEQVKLPAWQSWIGYTFETLCYKHITQIRETLGITVGAKIGAWRYMRRSENEKQTSKMGAQIDLLFDRNDGIVTICEIKYSEKPYVIDKDYYNNLINKIAVYKRESRTNKQIFAVMVAANGLKQNEYSGFIVKVVLLEDLFK